MKAYTINESLGFERGLDPKEAMRIGEVEKREKIKNLKIQLQAAKAKLARLKEYTDDPLELQPVRKIITKINRQLETPEQAAKREEREYKAADKREKERRIKEKTIKEKIKTLTPRQVAINQIVDMQYWIRSMNSREDKIRRQQLAKEIQDLKDKYNLKSYDIRRQKSYDPHYE